MVPEVFVQLAFVRNTPPCSVIVSCANRQIEVTQKMTV